ncbi:hypothetical protein LXL04_035177 [Taraxacum kok-saghyz]
MEFAVEVEVLGRVPHKNLLGLKGFYASGDERLIVYDYMPLVQQDCRRVGPLERLTRGIKRDIIQWVTPFVQKDSYEHIVDPRLKGRFNHSQLKLVVKIALACTR